MSESWQGKLLVASPKLVDPNFFRSVVLIVQHTPDGALGLIINRPSEVELRAAWKRISRAPCRTAALLHDGGPCEGPLMVVHNNRRLSQEQVIPGVYFSTERDTIQQLVAKAGGKMKFFVGYAGWSRGQLEAEMEDGGWLSVQASAEQIFTDEDRWHALMRSAQRAHVLLDPSIIPDDPSLN